MFSIQEESSGFNDLTLANLLLTAGMLGNYQLCSQLEALWTDSRWCVIGEPLSAHPVTDDHRSYRRLGLRVGSQRRLQFIRLYASETHHTNSSCLKAMHRWAVCLHAIKGKESSDITHVPQPWSCRVVWIFQEYSLLQACCATNVSAWLETQPAGEKNAACRCSLHFLPTFSALY